jgi:hypothetical protein
MLMSMERQVVGQDQMQMTVGAFPDKSGISRLKRVVRL